MNKIILKILNTPSIVYTFRCIVGFLIGYYLFLKFNDHNLFWSIISIILVISPEEKDSKKLSIERVKANFIGSVAGLLTFYLPFEEDLFKILIGILLSIAICNIFNLMNVARSALVALVIILIEHKSESTIAPIMRFSTVFLGCMIGLTVTLFTSVFIQAVNRKLGYRP